VLVVQVILSHLNLLVLWHLPLLVALVTSSHLS
jgi:hypothetical protein